MPLRREKDSHKGENGKVAVIGGSVFQHGAPLFSALAAEAMGVDLIFVALPAEHEEVARMQSLNFQVHPFQEDELTEEDVEPILEMLATIDCAVIGPGLARDAATLKAMKQVIRSASCGLVLDASALQPWTLETLSGKNAVVTPHLGELERMGIALEEIGSKAKETGIVIHAKGPMDRIARTDGTIQEVTGGNAGLTVGGTGDALAGCIAGLIARGMERADACILASKLIKRCGEELAKERATYTTRDVIARIPLALKSLT
jgi:NAD(P)H-hydrate epimerase